MEGILPEGCVGQQAWPADAAYWSEGSQKAGGRVRTLKSDVLTSVSGLCYLLTVGFGANDFTSLSTLLFICKMINYSTCLIESW